MADQLGGGAKRVLHQFQEQYRARPQQQQQQRQCRVRGHVGERLPPPVLQDTSTGAVMSSLDSYLSAFTPLDECTGEPSAADARSTAAATNEQFALRMDTLIGVAKRAGDDDAAQEGSQFCSQYSNVAAAVGLLPCFETKQKIGPSSDFPQIIPTARIPSYRRTSLPPPVADGDHVPGSGDDESSSLLTTTMMMIPTEAAAAAAAGGHTQQQQQELPTTVRLRRGGGLEDSSGGDRVGGQDGDNIPCVVAKNGVFSSEGLRGRCGSLDDEEDEGSSYAATVVQEDDEEPERNEDHLRRQQQQHGGSTSLLSSRYDRRLNDLCQAASGGERYYGGAGCNESASARQGGAQLTAWETPPLPTTSSNSWTHEDPRHQQQQHRFFEPPGSFTTAVDGQQQQQQQLQRLLPFSPRPYYREQHLPLRDSEWVSTNAPPRSYGAFSPTQHRQAPNPRAAINFSNRVARGFLGRLPTYPHGDSLDAACCLTAAANGGTASPAAGGMCWHNSSPHQRLSTAPTCAQLASSGTNRQGVVSCCAASTGVCCSKGAKTDEHELYPRKSVEGAALSPHNANRSHWEPPPPPAYSFARYALPGGGKRRRTTTGGSARGGGGGRQPQPAPPGTHTSAAGVPGVYRGGGGGSTTTYTSGGCLHDQPVTTTSIESDLAKKRNRGFVKLSPSSTVQQRSLTSETPDSTTATRFGGGKCCSSSNAAKTTTTTGNQQQPATSTAAAYEPAPRSSRRSSHHQLTSNLSERITSSTTGVKAIPSGRMLHPGRATTSATLPASTPPPNVWEAIGITPQTTAAAPVMHRTGGKALPPPSDSLINASSKYIESPPPPAEMNGYARQSLKKEPPIANGRSAVCSSEMASNDRGGRNILGRLFKTLASPRVTHR